MRDPACVFRPLAGVLLTDRVTKRAIGRTIPEAGARPVPDDVVRFTLASSEGAAFSSSVGRCQRRVLIGVTPVILAAIARRHGHSPRGAVYFIDVGVDTSRFHGFGVADAWLSVADAVTRDGTHVAAR